MKSIRQILQNKSIGTVTVGPKDSVYAALEKMAAQGVGALLVMEGDTLVGIFSERDYARKVALSGKHSKDTPVAEVMTDKVLFVTPNQTVSECLALITEKRVRHLPVLENGKVLGVVSIGDLVKEKIAEQSFIIEQLERYITT